MSDTQYVDPLDIEEPVDISPEQNGGMLKLVKTEGVGTKCPLPGDTVKVLYKTFLAATARRIDSNRDNSYGMKVTLGKNQLIEVVEQTIPTMKLKELCEVFCLAKYAFGDEATEKVPANTELIIEIELLEWEGEDISPEKDESMFRSIKIYGEGDEFPKDGCLVRGHLTAYFDEFQFLDEDFEHQLGECTEFNLPKGVDVALRRFKKGEQSLVTLKPKWAYGGEGNKPMGIPPWNPISVLITLEHFEEKKSFTAMSSVELLKDCEHLKCWAALQFKKSKYELAIAKFERILVLLSDETKFVGTQKRLKRTELRLAAHSNLALCHLKLKNARETIEQCNLALEVDRNVVKIYYRRAEAYELRKDYQLAILDYDRVLTSEPQNKAARQKKQICEKILTTRKEKREAQIYKNIHGPWGFNEFKPPKEWTEKHAENLAKRREKLEYGDEEPKPLHKFDSIQNFSKELPKYEIGFTKHYDPLVPMEPW